MKTYTEDDLRMAFKAGYERGAFDANNNYFDAPLDEDEYIESLKEKVVEETVSLTYSFLRRKLDWEQFCDLTGVSYYAKKEGYEIKDNEVFEITESEAKQYGLL